MKISEQRWRHVFGDTQSTFQVRVRGALLSAVITLPLLLGGNESSAFECTDASGTLITAPDDGGDPSNTACGDGAVTADTDPGINDGAVAIGGDDPEDADLLGAQASGIDAVAIGADAVASGNSTTAVGGEAEAIGILVQRQLVGAQSQVSALRLSVI